MFRLKNGEIDGLQVSFATILALLVFVASLMWIIPGYTVWQRGLSGKAELKQAEWNRQIAIREAEAKKESASLLAEAEVARARGVAQANEIIGSSLKENEAYLRYLWIQGMQTNQMQVIYVPTEGNLPILEAERFSQYDKSR